MPDPKEPAPDPQPEKEEPTVTEQELADRVAAAVEAARKEEREKARKARKRKEPEPEAEEDDEEDPQDIIRKAELKVAEAQQRADEAEKKALLADVSVRLRDYLATNYPQYVKSAPDIMLHVEKALSPGAKDAEIVRVYESHAKAFMDRNPIARKPASGAPTGGVTRSPTDVERKPDGRARLEASERRPPAFSSLNYHG